MTPPLPRPPARPAGPPSDPAGPSTVITAARSRPTASERPMSRGSVSSAYRIAARRRLPGAARPTASVPSVTVAWRPSAICTMAPPNTPVTSAITGRNTAKSGPSSAPVTAIESTPVWGVEIRNAVVAAGLAP